MLKRISTPLTKEKVENIVSGDKILLSGTIYTLRDAGHKRFVETMKKGEKLPINIQNEILYYVGPTPCREEEIIGSCGPTTSYRMDDYTPILLEHGLKGMIGKGNRSKEVIRSIEKNTAVYFGAIGGVAALIASCIKSVEVIAYEDLGAESLKKLEVEEMPLIAIIDEKGNNLYESEIKKYKEILAK